MAFPNTRKGVRSVSINVERQNDVSKCHWNILTPITAEARILINQPDGYSFNMSHLDWWYEFSSQSTHLINLTQFLSFDMISNIHYRIEKYFYSIPICVNESLGILRWTTSWRGNTCILEDEVEGKSDVQIFKLHSQNSARTEVKIAKFKLNLAKIEPNLGQ